MWSCRHLDFFFFLEKSRIVREKLITAATGISHSCPNTALLLWVFLVSYTYQKGNSVQFSSVQSLSRVQLFVIPWTPPSQLPTNHTLSLHPVKLLGFLLSRLLVPSLEGFSLPSLPSLPSSHTQLLFHPSDTSLPSPRLPPCGPLAMVEPTGLST